MSAAELFKTGVINKQQKIVLTQLLKKANTNRKLSEITGLPINVITPRVYQLRRKDLVKNAGKVYDNETNRTVNLWAPAV